MKIIVYIYTDPLLDTVPNQNDWGWEVDKIYEDLGKRSQLQQLLTDCQTETVNYLLVRRLEELGDTLVEVSDRLNQLETMGVVVIATQQAYTSKSSQIRAELLELCIETGILDSETAKLRAYKLRTEISELQAKLAILPPVNLYSVAQAVSIPQFWLDLSEVERRFYFREFIQKIQIIRQNGEWDLQIIFII